MRLGGRRIHFIGIGGIGMSALARYFRSEECLVSGSDLVRSELTAALEREGVLFRLGHAERNVALDTDLVVYSAAVAADNSERIAAAELGIKTLSYAEAVGELTRRYETVAVSGSHGKSTTTALLALILTVGGLDPTVIVGTKLREFGNSNFRKGQGSYFVLEADEWNRSFLTYSPKVIVLTNIDREHLDTYKTYDGVVRGFSRYLRRLQSGGTVVANWSDRGVRRACRRARCAERGTIAWYNRKPFRKHPLTVSGAHNQLNAEAAWQAAKLLGVRKSAAETVFKKFRGSWRRQEQIAVRHPQLGRVFSDYAHHPTEIAATIQAFRDRYPSQPLAVIFQPHQQDRLTRLFDEFARCFRDADTIVILPVYAVAGRERGKHAATDAFALAQRLRIKRNSVFYAATFSGAAREVGRLFGGRGITVVMGAGDIDEQARRFLQLRRFFIA